MPIYEYFCPDCRTKFEALRPMSQADAPIACDRCAGPHASRMLSVFAVGGDRSETETSGPGCGCGGACACGHSQN